MDAALRALLAGLVDYAGLFPPANLDMAPAVRNHLAYRAGPDRFMLGRFICPARRIEELGACLPEALDGPLDLSVILRGDGVGDDLEATRAIVARAPVRAGAFEIRIPEATAGAIEEIAACAAEAGFAGVPMFLEVGWPAAGHGPAVAGIREARAKGLPASLKIRTGGLDAAAFPSPAAVADAILASRDAGVPFKATAGLHHPVRRFDSGVGATMHGFLNVFGGAILAGVHGSGMEGLVAILEETDPAAFGFEEGRFDVRGRSAAAEAVERWRGTLAVSFGSCSFDEPRDDLRSIGLMS